MQLRKQYGDKIECISVSLDYVGATEEDKEAVTKDVMAKLEKNNIAVRNLIQSDPEFNFVKKTGLVIPVVMVYDAAGELKQTFSSTDRPEPFTYEKDVNPLVASLMTAGASTDESPAKTP